MESRFSLAILLLVSCHLYAAVAVDYSHTIYIHPSTGADSPDCLTANSPHSPCSSLTWVFQQTHSSSTHYVLSGGTHYLEEPSPPFKDLTFLAFTGNSSVVTCTDTNTGLAFIKVTNVLFRDVTFSNCSSLRNSTSRKYDYDHATNFSFVLYEFYVALYFYQCMDVTMTQLTVTKSPGATAVVMYNTIGSNKITDSSFTYNRLEATNSTEYPGGGGFYVEFTYCIPGDFTCSDFEESINNFNKDADYLFRNVSFHSNKASNLLHFQNMDTYIIPFKKIQNSFGKGGGLALIFKGNATNISVQVSGCVFEGNEAVWGGGLAVEYQDHSSNITVVVQQTNFSANGLGDQLGIETAGGGVRVGHYVYDSESRPLSLKNHLFISECELSHNLALNGGGISIFPVRQLVHDTDQLFDVTVTDSNFLDNNAQIGAAIETTLFSLFNEGQLPSVTIKSTNFASNSIYGVAKSASIREVGVGAVYTNGIPIRFRDVVTFEENVGSALAVVGTFVDFSHSNATFAANKGNSGGAMSFLGSSFLLINSNTSMVFVGNKADINGGAIANVFTARENFKAYPNCFVRHVKPFVHPEDWGATFKFIDNVAGILGPSIYTTSLNPCAWAGGSGLGQYSKILCWEDWAYIRNGSPVNCHREMNTDSGMIEFTDTESSVAAGRDGITITAVPGNEFVLPIQIRDDLNKVVNNQTVFTARSYNTSVSSVNPRYTFVSGEYIRMDGVGGNNVTVMLQSNNERAWEVEVSVELLECPPGFVSSKSDPPSDSHCMCDKNNYGGKVHCLPESKEAQIVNGYWFGLINDTKDGEMVYATSLCLPGFCVTENNHTLKTIPSDPEVLTDEMCGGENRQGILCGECREGFGPSINSENYKCISCNDSMVATSIVKYIFSTYVPLLALFIFIIVFSIRLTSGPANAFIFYAQVVSSTFDLNADSHIPLQLITRHTKALLQAYRVPYGIFNLDFIESFVGDLCIGTNLTALDILELDYLIAFFPLVMIIIVVVAVRIKDSSLFTYYCRRCSFQSSTWKFLRHWKANESLLHAFSAFLLLSYIKFSLTSSYLVNVHPFYNSEGDVVGERRAYYAGKYTATDLEYIFRYKLPACIVLTLIAVPPLVLFGYPVVWFERALMRVKCLWRFYPADKVQIFLDTFQGCYKDNRRFFAGMYFAFRLAINVCYILTDDWLQQFVAQQVLCTVFIFIIAFCWPYREEKWYVNYVDLLIFTNLATVNALSLYLFAYAQINSQLSNLTLPEWPFIIQYILVFLPLLYMLLYVAWYLLPARQKEILKKLACFPLRKFRKWKREKYLCTTIIGPSEGVRPDPKPKGHSSTTEYVVGKDGVSTTEITIDTESESEVEEDLPSDDAGNLEAILVRAQTQNTYRSTSTTQTLERCTPSTRGVTKDSGWSSLGGATSGSRATNTYGRRSPLSRDFDLSVSIRSTDGGFRDGGMLDTIAELYPSKMSPSSMSPNVSPRGTCGQYGSIND